MTASLIIFDAVLSNLFMQKLVLFLAVVLLLAACTSKPEVQKLSDGVLVRFPKSNSTRVVKLEVMNDHVIHVQSSPTDSIPADTSLVILRNAKKSTEWKLVEEENQISIVTQSIRAVISSSSGAVSFTDLDGKPILVEKEGGRTFSPTTIGNEKTYEVRQVFESADDEAFYGLGQHQEGVMNHKGKDLSLFQYNTKVAVPLVVSNKNYGILWHNYSLTKFGDPREYRSLNKLQLFDKDGNPGGLSARYISKEDTTKIFISRLDTAINYQFLSDQKKFPTEFPVGKGKVYWDGFVSSDSPGIHKFLIYYAGYTKVWIDGKQVADHWRQAWNPGTIRSYFHFEKDKKYPIKIEWNPDGGESYLSVTWREAHEDQDRLSLYSELGNTVDYYFIAGKNTDDVIAGYRSITGKSPVFPKWALGFWQSRERYKSQEEILSVVSEFRKRKIPLDNIVQDWFYWKENEWGSQQFDPARFPDPAGMIKQLHERHHTQFMISVWPKFYEGIDNYKVFESKGWLYKLNITNRQKDWVGPGYVSTFFDAFNPDARKAFWSLVHDNLYTKGVDAWWLDASEPDILSNASVEQRKLLMSPTALGPGAKYFNAYPLVNEMEFYDGQRRANPDQRVVILTRSAFAGSQRYGAATWSGDIGAIWKDFETQIPAGLNFSLSGIPFWTTDIGGFSVENRFYNAQGETLEEWREQMTRWYQFGAFCPLFRAHGQYPFREIFNVAPESHLAYQSMVYYNKLRYRLLPYLYSLAGKVYLDDYTPMRALAMDFGSDLRTLNIGSEYLLGPSLLVAPVTSYKAKTKEVYLQAGNGWYEFHSGKFFEGGQSMTVDAPYERIPVFVKEGSILPAGPELQYALEADPITLYVFTGKDADFVIYEDEGVNNNYEKGAYATIAVSYNESSKSLTIGERKGEFKGMLATRTFEIVWVYKNKPVGVSLSAKADQKITYQGQEILVQRN
jgi:alpha-D-xyloside xylohydrolase